jgi:Reverse transcriptase (RNA-dependent DNA polymerase)
LGVDEWLVRVIEAMFEGVSTAVKLGEEESVAFPVRVASHQGSVRSPMMFIILLEALSREFRFRTGSPCELLHADDLVLTEDSEKLMDELRA